MFAKTDPELDEDLCLRYLFFLISKSRPWIPNSVSLRLQFRPNAQRSFVNRQYFKR